MPPRWSIRALLRLATLVAALLAVRRAPAVAATGATDEGDRVVAASEPDAPVSLTSAEPGATRVMPRPEDGRLPHATAARPRAPRVERRPAAPRSAVVPGRGGAEQQRVARRHVPRLEPGEPPRG